MQTVRDHLLSLFFVCGFLIISALIGGCGKKSQAVKDDTQDDLFVEVYEYYFPQRIETLALGEFANYRGKGGRLFSRPFKRKRFSESDSLPDQKLVQNLPSSRRHLLRAAQSAIGTPYVVGGMSPGGFDCSGLVCWAYGNVGVKLPRTAREQSVIGTRIGRMEDMQAGDIVAFRHPKRGYHTGIYVGGGKFIHSPRRKSHVKINSLNDPYFSETFLGARRVNIGSRENLLAQAESRLEREFPQLPRRHRVNREDSHSSRNASYDRASRYRKSMAAYRNKRRSKYRDETYVAERSMEKERRRAEREERKGRSKKREQLLAENKKGKVLEQRERDKRRHRDDDDVRSTSKRQRQEARHESRSERNRHSSLAQKNERKKSRQAETEKRGKSEKKRSVSRKS